MPNALLYSPIFDGHRQMYVYVLSDILCETGFTVFIAGNFKEKINDSSYIDRIQKNKALTTIDTSVYARAGLGITNSEFLELQNKCNADLTVFVEADHHISLFNSQLFSKRKKLRGKLAGIFLRPFHFYKPLNFIDRLRYIKHLPSTWKADDRLFHEHLLKQFKLVDSAMYIDENFVSHHPHSHWLPDVFQSYTEGVIRNESKDERIWIDRLDRFKEKNKGKFIFLYFGTSQKRRGYDLLLKMAVEKKVCFIHCGLTDQKESNDSNITLLKKDLEDAGRLLETNQYITDPVCIEAFFRSVTHLVLPYSDFWGSSGVMLQALGYGIPVLVPEEGIMGYRVKKFNLGATYGNAVSSLYEQFEKFKEIPGSFFKESIEEYMKYQNPVQLKNILVNIFKDSDPDAKYSVIMPKI